MSGTAVEDIDDEVDVVLIVGKTRFYGHRRLLALKSPYFAAMFQSEMIECRSGLVQLQGVCPSAVAVLMSYVKTDKIEVQMDVLPKLLEAAVMLQFDEVVRSCAERLLDILGTANCLGIMNLADRLALTDLHLRAKHMAMWYFVQVATQESEIVDVPLQCLLEYFSHDAIRVQSELQVFEAVTRWIQHDRRNRMAHFEELVSVVRFSELSLKEVKTVIVHELVKDCRSVRAIIRQIFLIRLTEQSADRLGSNSCTPLSGISPADDDDSNAAALASPSALLEKTELCKEMVVARRLLMTKPRCIPTVPAVIKFGEGKTHSPELVYFDGTAMKTITSMTKVFQKNHVALGFKACAVGNFVVVIGGEYQYGRNNWNMSTWKYNIFSKTWCFLSNLRNPRRHHTLCSLDDYIYIVGGIGRFRVAVNTAEKMCLTTGNLIDLSPMPKPIYSAVSVGYAGKIYVVDTNAYRYDPSADVWMHLKNVRLPHEIQLHSAIAHAHGIYLIGTCPTDIILLNVSDINGRRDTKAYQKISQFSHKSQNACIANDKIYSFGSSSDGDGESDGHAAERLVVESYDLITGESAVEYGKSSASSDVQEAVGTAVVTDSSSSEARTVGPATVHYGCFSLPKYFT